MLSVTEEGKQEVFSGTVMEVIFVRYISFKLVIKFRTASGSDCLGNVSVTWVDLFLQVKENEVSYFGFGFMEVSLGCIITICLCSAAFFYSIENY